MRQVLLIVDVQSTFSPPEWLVDGVRAFAARLPAIASIELHDEQVTPFNRQLGWHPAAEDHCMVEVDRVFVKHGYGPPAELIAHLKAMNVDRVLVCGLQAETCVLAAGFALFDAGLSPTLVTDLIVGSSLDRSGQLGRELWTHHFGQVTTVEQVLMGLGASKSGLNA